MKTVVNGMKINAKCTSNSTYAVKLLASQLKNAFYRNKKT